MSRAAARAAAARAARLALTFASLTAGLAACASRPRAADTSSGATPASESAGEWRALFDGTSTDAWRAYRRQDMGTGWSIVDGTLTKSGSASDLVTRDEFGDFELAWDWKLAPHSNSGIFYRATEEYDFIYWSGPEYQLTDDAGTEDGESQLTATASLYALYPSRAGVVKPAGEWNSSRLVVRGARAEHWLNGQKVAEYQLWNSDWEARVKASKFGAWPNFGRARRGHIGIQGDHPGQLALRDIRIRELR